MGDKRFHIRIDEEVLKPLRLIPKNFDTEWIHIVMDEGTKTHGWLHRVMDKWHEPRYVVNVGKNTKRIPISKENYKESNYVYRVAKVHRVVDELWSRSKDKKNCYVKIKNFLLRKLRNKNLIRRNFKL